MINAGDGQHEHPTQALLDALSHAPRIRPDRGARRWPSAATSCTAASRARTSLMLTDAGRARAPGRAADADAGRRRALGRRRLPRPAPGVAGADVVMMLRLQLERMRARSCPPRASTSASGASTARSWRTPRPDVRVMHPGPMNRGVEIDSDVADDLARQPDPGPGGDGRRRAHGGPGLASPRGWTTTDGRGAPDRVRRRAAGRPGERLRRPGARDHRRRRDRRGGPAAPALEGLSARHRAGRLRRRHAGARASSTCA